MTFKETILKNVLKTLSNTNRTSSIDVFRGIAILTVVIYHFNEWLPYGYLGVDLFFVISGLLIGGILINLFANDRLNYWAFILQRGFKIWPSYYFFIFVGIGLSYLFYRNTHPEYLITVATLPRYLFFFRNFVGFPAHKPFDHIWSLCVEEHFYIILPLLFLVCSFLPLGKNKIKMVFIGVILTILFGIVIKYISYNFTNSKDTSIFTFNRVDALGWGVLLSLIINYYPQRIKNILQTSKKLIFGVGLSLFIGAIILHKTNVSVFFSAILFFSVIPFSFFLMILSTYYSKFDDWFVIRFIAYFSYNWYLWHVLFVQIISEKIGTGILGLVLYLVITFTIAILATYFIEEPFLKLRNKIYGIRKTSN